MNLKMSITWDLESAQGDVQRKSQMQIKKIGVWSFKITCVCAQIFTCATNGYTEKQL